MNHNFKLFQSFKFDKNERRDYTLFYILKSRESNVLKLKSLLNILTEPPQSTSDCPRQFGYFRLGDETKCGQFLNCVNGIGYKFDCPEGLAFNELTFRCDWPDQVDTCDAEGKL